MSTLAEFTGPELMAPELKCGDASSVVAELSQTLKSHGRIADARELSAAILRRETLSSTACAPGFALPHARLNGVSSVSFALGRCAEPLRWFAGNEPVRLVFLFAVPETAAATYLAVISGIARLSQNRAQHEQLLRAADSKSLFESLRQIALRLPRSVSRPMACAR